jgi:lipoprotein-anchoring transpeptidase ErfK/SrfK
MRVGLAALLAVCALAGAGVAVLAVDPGAASSVGTTSTTTETTATTTTETIPATIPPGVTIGGVAVGGLSPETAFVIVRTAYSAPVTLTYRDMTFQPSPETLGAVAYIQAAITRARTAAPNTQVQLVVKVRGAKLREYLAGLAKRFERPAVDAKLVLRKVRPFLTKERVGRRLDRSTTTRDIIDTLVANERFPIELAIDEVKPNATRKNFGPVIVIRRDSNRLFLYDGMKYRRLFRVATGSSRYPTPLGRFRVVVKWRNPWWYPPDSDWARDDSPIPPGPGNPLGTRWMGLSVPAVGIHGTPDAASLGYSVSHGCIRMAIPDAEWLFQQVRIGTPVFIVSA